MCFWVASAAGHYKLQSTFLSSYRHFKNHLAYQFGLLPTRAQYYVVLSIGLNFSLKASPRRAHTSQPFDSLWLSSTFLFHHMKLTKNSYSCFYFIYLASLHFPSLFIHTFYFFIYLSSIFSEPFQPYFFHSLPFIYQSLYFYKVFYQYYWIFFLFVFLFLSTLITLLKAYQMTNHFQIVSLPL